MDIFVMVCSIFNKGVREETEHRPRQGSLDVELNYRRILRNGNPNGVFVLNFFSNVCVPEAFFWFV